MLESGESWRAGNPGEEGNPAKKEAREGKEARRGKKGKKIEPRAPPRRADGRKTSGFFRHREIAPPLPYRYFGSGTGTTRARFARGSRALFSK